MASTLRDSLTTLITLSVSVMLGLTFMLSVEALGHGSMETPVSRVLNCRLENPEDPHSAACREAVAVSGTQPLYDWNGIRQGDANGQHRSIVPDGQLCSGGDPTFAGLDLPRGDWPTTPIAAASDGHTPFVFRATAPHSTQYMELYVTKDGYDPTKPLAWGDLEPQPFCTVTSPFLENGRYHLSCPVPTGKVGKHLIYHIWQRADSPEAFYTCIDVEFLNNEGDDPSSYHEIGQIRAQADLPLGSVVILRLFAIDPSNGEFSDLESHSMRIGESMGAHSQWPYYLAQQVNAASNVIKVGLLHPNGSIQPVMEAQGNHVYTQSDQQLAFDIDVRFPDPSGEGPPVAVITASQTEILGSGTIRVSAQESSDEAGLPLQYQWAVISGNANIASPSAVDTEVTFPEISEDQIVTFKLSVSNGELEGHTTLDIHHKARSGGNVDFVYPDGQGQYHPGTVVLGSDGSRYECRPFPNSGWCNIESDLYYAPGTGLAWQEAWIRLAE